MILKILKYNIITVLASFLIILAPAGLFAQEGEGGYDESGYSDDSGSSYGGVNSGFWGIILSGSYGYGQTTFGYVIGSSSDSTLGVGPGGAFDLSAMLNLSIFAVKLEYAQASLDTLKWSLEGHDFETSGNGNYSTLDFLFGLKLFTEEGDMGYTHLYGGYRYWTVKRDENEKRSDGAPNGLFDAAEYEQTGGGWIAGYYDLTTLPLGFFSIALETGLWVDRAPFNTLKVDGSDTGIDADESIGFGLQVGAGVAFEDIGLLVTAGLKMDISASQFLSDNITGAGYAVGYLAVSLEF